MSTADGYKWVDHLIENKFAHKSIKDVWVAALSATAGFMVERRKLDQNPFLRMKVREDKSDDDPAMSKPKEPPRKGFTPEEAELILTATLATPSHLISVEMRAARRWLPWLCAYSGARVNELTSLHPDDIPPGKKGIRCMVIKPSLEKTAQWRVVPIHSHVIEQGFMDYVEERQKLNKPLFYDPDRGRGGKPGNPQFKKVAERIAEMGARPRHHPGGREAEPRLAPSLQERGSRRRNGPRGRRLHHGAPPEEFECGKRLRRPMDSDHVGGSVARKKR
jgi:integrase